MHLITQNSFRVACSTVALAFITASAATAQSRAVLPAGRVIIVRTTAPLQHAPAQAGQTCDTPVGERTGADDATANHPGAPSHANSRAATGCSVRVQSPTVGEVNASVFAP